MHPKRAMRRYAIKAHLRFGERVLDFLRALEAVPALKHVIGRLRARCAGLFGVIEELREVLGAVLRPFDAGMETFFGHNVGLEVNWV